MPLNYWVIVLLGCCCLGIPSLVLPGTVGVMAQDHDQSQSAVESWRELLQVEDLDANDLELLQMDSLTPTVIVDETPSPTDQYNASSVPSPSPTSLFEDFEDFSSSPTLSADNAPDTLPPSMMPSGVEQPEEDEAPQEEDGDSSDSQPTTDSAAVGNSRLDQLYGYGSYPKLQVVVIPTILFVAGLPAVLFL